MRQQLDSGPREDTPLIVDRSNGERLCANDSIDGIAEFPFTQSRVERYRGGEFVGEYLLDRSAKPHNDRITHVHDNAAVSMPRMLDGSALLPNLVPYSSCCAYFDISPISGIATVCFCEFWGVVA